MLRLSATKQITLSGMVVAISVLCLYAAGMLPAGRVPLLYLASLMTVVLVNEGAYISAILSYIAACSIAFFIAPDKTSILIYALLPGHFGIFRAVLLQKVQSRVFRLLWKLLYSDVFLVAGLYVALRFFTGFSIALPEWLPVWGAVLLLQPFIILFDVLYGAGVALYITYFRKAIIPR